MINNHAYRLYSRIMMMLTCTMIILIALLAYEYKSFCCIVREIENSKQQYYDYKNETRKSLEDVGLEDEVERNSNEDVCGLAQVEQEMDKDECAGELLMTSLDANQWERSDSILPVPALPVISNTAKKIIPKEPVLKGNYQCKDFGFMWPIEIDKFWLSSLFGPRKRLNGTVGFHNGIDMAAIKGTHVKAVEKGRIVEASFQSGYGNTVVIQHTPCLKTRYAHLHTICVHVGNTVYKGSIIGTVGETGFIRKKGKDGSHLHFEVYEKNKRINPLHCLPQMG